MLAHFEENIESKAKDMAKNFITFIICVFLHFYILKTILKQISVCTTKYIIQFNIYLYEINKFNFESF